MEADRFEQASSLLVAARAWLGEQVPGGWCRRQGDQVASVTGIAASTMNGVWAAHPDPAGLAELLAAVGETGLPYCAQFVSGSAIGRSAAAGAGLSREDDAPLMYTAARPGPVVAPGLIVRRLGSAELAVHAELAAAGFGAPPALFSSITELGSAAGSPLRFYVAEADGEAVATGLGLVLLDHVGIFNVATPPEHRRRGYGAAVTARIVEDAFAEGAKGAWLQSTPDGHGVYRRLGFAEVGAWECWVSDAAEAPHIPA